MSSLFVSVLRQAIKTFDRANSAAFNVNFAKLKQLTEQLTFRDIHLQPQQFETVFKRSGRAPCTFVHIFENDFLSMSVFVLREGYTMPLHDHPCMYGVLRGIFGKLRIQSYTKAQLEPNEPPYDGIALEVYAHENEPKIVDSGTECATLTPIERNYHEITAVGGVAAFFDILSPPYDADIPKYGSRQCSFYRVLGKQPSTGININSGLVEEQAENAPLTYLQWIPAPLNYHCDILDTPEEVLQSTAPFLEDENNLF
ncbi:2-aminoethanethiol dioxygenase [Ceratitis capitata]|uniref:2-aminoethanethiol dioxygenase n=1 Tax=Ceratitis capitata TaxID=7213 RepID=UPI000329EA5B|nr:2-aminoethanethiol dioxygenase [Ceratitis capitata]